jgi:hypothetical protein
MIYALKVVCKKGSIHAGYKALISGTPKTDRACVENSWFRTDGATFRESRFTGLGGWNRATSGSYSDRKVIVSMGAEA